MCQYRYYMYTHTPMFKAIRINAHATFAVLCTCSTFTLDVSVLRMSKRIGHQLLVFFYTRSTYRRLSVDFLLTRNSDCDHVALLIYLYVQGHVLNRSSNFSPTQKPLCNLAVLQTRVVIVFSHRRTGVSTMRTHLSLFIA